MSSKDKLNRLILSALFLALALVLPLLTGQIQQIGNALCPMHTPVLLCGFICGPWYGLIVGLIAPILRFFIFGMPPLMPIGIAMSVELLTYGFSAGILYNKLSKTKINVYVSLIFSMIFGRLAWGIIRALLYGLGKADFGFAAFVSGAFINAVPGIILQIILIPFLVILIKKHFSEGK